MRQISTERAQLLFGLADKKVYADGLIIPCLVFFARIYYFLLLQLDFVPCGGRKKSPRTHL